MTEFEILDRDGLARLGRFDTPHGPVETPALLPVVHPDPTRQVVPPTEIRRRFGLGAVITSSYITWRDPTLRARAEVEGIHGLLGFDGPVMTDSGAFQQHAYGSVEVTPDEILGFQRRIGSDIPTVLDIFVEPESPREVAEAGVTTTLDRARVARELTRGLLAVPVQGGRFDDLRLRSAMGGSELGDVLAVGGVVPLLEQYRFADLARVLIATRPGLAPERIVHLFGTGHPISFAFAALFGVDLFDSSSYHKFARRGALLFPDGTVQLDDVREAICRCSLCEKIALSDVAKLPPAERERHVAEHNLLQCAREVSLVRQAIRDGRLWELAERRAAGHPGLLAGIRAAVRGGRIFLSTEPESRRSFQVVGATSGLRPSVIRFLARLAQWRDGKGPFRPLPWRPLVPSVLKRLETTDAAGSRVDYEVKTPVGAVPFELSELYPVGCYVGLEEFEATDDGAVEEHDDAFGASPDDARLSAWTTRHVAALFEWLYGPVDGAKVAALPLVPVRSKKSGRLRRLLLDGAPAFSIGNDGIPRPSFAGAKRLMELLPPPRARIIVSPDAEPFVADGRSLFSQFVEGGDSSLVPGASALLVDRSDRLLAVGRLLLAPTEMGRLSRGVAVRVTAHARRPDSVPDEELEEGPASIRGQLPPVERGPN